MEQPRRVPKNSYRWVRSLLRGTVLVDDYLIERGKLAKSKHALLVGGLVVGRLVLLQWSGAPAIEEVHRLAGAAAAVGGLEGAVEEWQEVDIGSVVLSGGEDSGDGDTNVWLGVCEGLD
jgi:hypothetical protein